MKIVYKLTAYTADGRPVREREITGKRRARMVMAEMIHICNRLGGYVKAEPDPFITKEGAS